MKKSPYSFSCLFVIFLRMDSLHRVIPIVLHRSKSKLVKIFTCVRAIRKCSSSAVVIGYIFYSLWCHDSKSCKESWTCNRAIETLIHNTSVERHATQRTPSAELKLLAALTDKIWHQRRQWWRKPFAKADIQALEEECNEGGGTADYREKWLI